MAEQEEVQTAPEEEVQQEQESAEESKPELTDEQIATALGVDVEYLQAVKPEIQNLKGFYAKVNKRNQELVEAQKRLDSQPKEAAKVEDDDDIDLDPQAQKVLRKFIQKEFAPILSTMEQERTETAASIMDDFISDHRDVEPEKVYEAMQEMGLWQVATTPAKLKKALNSAYKYVKNETTDIDAEIEKRLAERLKSLKSDGEEIVEVKSKRTQSTGNTTVGQVIDNPNMAWPDMMRLLQDD